MKVQVHILRAVLIDGKHAAEGTVHEVPINLARDLVARGRAEAVEVEGSEVEAGEDDEGDGDGEEPAPNRRRRK